MTKLTVITLSGVIGSLLINTIIISGVAYIFSDSAGAYTTEGSAAICQNIANTPRVFNLHPISAA